MHIAQCALAAPDLRVLEDGADPLQWTKAHTDLACAFESFLSLRSLLLATRALLRRQRGPLPKFVIAG